MEILENYNSLSKEQKEMLMDSSKEKIKEKIDEVFLPLEKRLEIAKKFTNDYHKSFKKTLPEMEAYTDISRSFFEKIIDTSLSLLKVCIPVFIGLISIRESTAFTNFVDINVARKSLCVLLVAIFTIGILFPFLGYRKIIRRLDKVLSLSRRIQAESMERSVIERDILLGRQEFQKELEEESKKCVEKELSKFLKESNKESI